MESDGSSMLWGVIGFVYGIAAIIGLWKVFVKAGKPGWAAVVPFYNLYVILKIVGKPGWWLVLYFIPFVSIVISIIVAIALAKTFNKGTIFGIFLLGIFASVGYLILGFGKATYAKPAASTPAVPTPAAPTPPPAP